MLWLMSEVGVGINPTTAFVKNGLGMFRSPLLPP